MDDLRSANLNLTTCLVVEDQAATLSLLSSIMSMLSVGRVLPVHSAAEAIELLESIDKNPARVGIAHVDFAVIDWNLDGEAFRNLNTSEFFAEANTPEEEVEQHDDRPPVQGVDLARWIRRRESTTFMPLLAISAYSNARLIDLVRDSGMNSFVSKPFNVADIARHVQHVVQDIRPHISTPSRYLGPERRRTNHPVATDRRVSQSKVKSVSPPRTLRNKTSGNYQVSGTDVSEIMDQMATLAPPDYLEYIAENLAMIEDFMSRIDTENGDPSDNMSMFREIDYICNKILGHQGCFSYQVVAEAVAGVSRFIGDKYFYPSEQAYLLVRQQLASAKYFANKKMKGPSSRRVRELFTTTAEVMNRVLSRNRKQRLGLNS